MQQRILSIAHAMDPLKEGGQDRPNSLVVAKVEQGYTTNINFRLVPGRDISIALKPKGCQPRTGAPRRDTDLLDLPAPVVEKLKKANKAVVAWLAADEGNAQLFLANPAEALAKAGVDLDRAEKKAIDRTHREVREAAVVAPGVDVKGIKAVAFPTGKIGKVKPGTGSKPGGDDIAGCGKE
jgi:hypothetical protein